MNDINTATPLTIFVDLNSAFASIEQQANIHLRNKPLVIAAHASNGGCIVSPSIEAKKLGIKVGMRVGDAKRIYPDICVLTPDPDKYRHVSNSLLSLLSSYAGYCHPLSIDEAVLRLLPPRADQLSVLDTAYEIKSRLKSEIGDYLKCSIGIAPSTFLAKLASSLEKPDGLVVIDASNLESTYASLRLMDLPGINLGYSARLLESNIKTPLEFLHTPAQTLRTYVFRSIMAEVWYLRLRGFEVDSIRNSPPKSFSNSYVLPRATANRDLLEGLLQKLCEKAGRRLRANGLEARTINLGGVYDTGHGFTLRRSFSYPLFTSDSIFKAVRDLFIDRASPIPIAHLYVSLTNLTSLSSSQLSFFTPPTNRRLSKALDSINDRWGEYTIVPGRMLGLEDEIIDRISFGRSYTLA